MKQMITDQDISRWAGKVIDAIADDIDAGKVPADIASFAALHDHVDANMYVIRALEGAFPPVEHYGDEDADGNKLSDEQQAAVDAETDAANAVMDEVNRRLAARAAAGYRRPPMCDCGEMRHPEGVVGCVHETPLASAYTWCRTCGSLVENGKCGCWCMVADALQRYLGMDFDGSAQMAADLWEDADKERVWRADYADDHDVPVYDPPEGKGVRVTIGDDPAWTFTAARIDRERWNGWACPWFTEAEARKIAAASEAEYQRDPEATQEYIAVHEDAAPPMRFTLIIPAESEDWPADSLCADGVWLYAIGAANWTWEEAR